MNSLPIGIFDSGVGGLTVLRAVRRRLPHENVIYLGDTARVPYGMKSRGTIERYAVEDAGFLMRKGVKTLVIACNTATALALPQIKSAVGVPVLGVIEPGAESAAQQFALGREFLFRAGDATSLAERIDHYIEHPGELAAARERYHASAQGYAFEASIEQALAAYAAVLER